MAETKNCPFYYIQATDTATICTGADCKMWDTSSTAGECIIRVAFKRLADIHLSSTNEDIG